MHSYREYIRFISKVIMPQNSRECWLWNGGIDDANGYGYLSLHNCKVYPHRFSYEHFNGKIPYKAVVHHKCGNRICVNPYHLETMLRGSHTSEHLFGREKLICKHGHEMTGDNVYIDPTYNNRQCRVCRRITRRKYWLKKGE